LESNFTPNILTRLEAVKGVPLASLLEEFHETHGKASDYFSSSVQETEKKLMHWSKCQIGDRPPTWRELRRVLLDVGLVKLYKEINECLRGM